MSRRETSGFRSPFTNSRSNPQPTGATSDVGFQTKALHQLLTDLHLQVRLEAAEYFFAAFWIPRGEVAHQFVATLIFSVLAPADSGRNESRDDPDCNVGSRNHGRNKELTSNNCEDRRQPSHLEHGGDRFATI